VSPHRFGAAARRPRPASVESGAAREAVVREAVDRGAPGEADGPHPLEDSERLARQATAAVGLLERFGDLVIVALEAVGSGDGGALRGALAERERLMGELEPLLADLAAARHAAAATAGQNARAALTTILKPVDEALRHARLLHIRLTDEVDARPPLTLVR
jgi:hypothetical protein